jgi:hypothetical protein
MKIQNGNKSIKTNPSRRLAAYLGAGVCVAGTEARANLSVAFYGAGSPHGVMDIEDVNWGGGYNKHYANNRYPSPSFRPMCGTPYADDW